jgi:hypothetical protein
MARKLGWFVLLVFLSVGAGCRRKDSTVIIRILLPPSNSAVRYAIQKFELYPLSTEKGEMILPATMETSNDTRYQEFLWKIDTYRPEVVIVPAVEAIPAPLRQETRYATLPCSSASSSCIAVIGPWDTAKERQAADIVLRRLSSSER